MRNVIFIALLSFSFSNIIHVPDDYPTIQEGIDVSVEEDTVLISDSTYYENLIINKNITLASYFLINGDTTHRDNTIINGNTAEEEDIFGSCLAIGTGIGVGRDMNSREIIEPIIIGLTFTQGKGTWLVRTEVEEGDSIDVKWKSGGAILIQESFPRIEWNVFIDNGNNNEIEEGGAITVTDEDIDQLRRSSNRDTREDSLIFRNNRYLNNSANYGNTLMVREYDNPVDMRYSYFDVYNCVEEDVGAAWVYSENAEIDATEGEGDACTLESPDVYISPLGSDCVSCGTESFPFRTIGYALTMIDPDEDNVTTLHLAEGTYSPSNTGEEFPILMMSHLNLIGAGEEVTILDAEQTNRVITMDYCENNTISDLTITGGLAEGDTPNQRGGAIYLWASNPILENVTVRGNTAGSGGGMYLSSSNPILTHVIIVNNTTNEHGGGMQLYHSHPTLTHVTLSENTANGVGGGMYLNTSNPTLTNITISSNTANLFGGGMYLEHSNPTINNVTISENMANMGGGMLLFSSHPTLTHVTLNENTANGVGGGMYLNASNPTLTNSIIWDNTPESIYLSEGTPIINYSDIGGGWEGQGNIDADPLFTNPENDDFTLIEGSPCIDSGDPHLWYNDLDGTRSDMGVTGGLFILPNFISHNFGEVGDFLSSKQFNLYNYRETSITISSIIFGTSSFTTNTSFPIIIEPLQTGIINIEANNSQSGYIEDEMELISQDLPDGLSVSLSVEGVEGNVLTGNLSGTYPSATYRISGDLTIANDDMVILDPGTEFLFDGEYNFNIYGTLKAIGTETDSIIFDNYGDDKWRGFTLDNVTDETEFRYVRISGAEKNYGGGMYLNSSNLILTHVTIVNNNAGFGGGGGMYLNASNPNLTHITISNNTADDGGGGMFLSSSNPILTHVIIVNNTTNEHGGGMQLYHSHPTLTHVTLSENTANGAGGGMNLFVSNPTLAHVTIVNNTAEDGGGMWLGYSNPTLAHVTIVNNTAEDGGGMWLGYSNPTITNPTITNSIIWNNGSESIYLDPDEQPIITYSDIEGGWEGEGNIDIDPLFTNPDSSDNTLQEGSPCIDAGTSDLDGDGEEDITDYYGSAPDMGAFEWIPEMDIEELPIPTEYTLYPAYPNPFNPITTITYSIPEPTDVTIRVYDILGKQVVELINDYIPPGNHQVRWNADSYPSGQYFVKLTSQDYTQTQKIMLLK